MRTVATLNLLAVLAVPVLPAKPSVENIRSKTVKRIESQKVVASPTAAPVTPVPSRLPVAVLHTPTPVAGGDAKPAPVEAGSVDCGRYSKPLATGPVVDLGYRLNNEYGWASHWWALHRLWTCESSWDPTAVNPDSGACGVAQRVPCSGRSSWSAERQIRDGLDYIRDRKGYGNPGAAWEHFQRRGWY